MTPRKRNQFVVWLLFNVLAVVGDGYFSGGTVFGPPPPFETDTLSVLIVEDKPNRASLPLSQQQIVQAENEGSLIEWMRANCPGHWRIIDKDNPLTDDEQWAMDAKDVEHPAPPYIVASNGHSGTPGAIALPLDSAAAIAILEPLKARGR